MKIVRHSLFANVGLAVALAAGATAAHAQDTGAPLPPSEEPAPLPPAPEPVPTDPTPEPVPTDPVPGEPVDEDGDGIDDITGEPIPQDDAPVSDPL